MTELFPKSDVPFDELIPSEFRTEQFLKAWCEWVEYRKEIKKPMKITAARRVMRRLHTYGHNGALQSIDNAIVRGWTGIFEPKAEDVQPTTPESGAINPESLR